ncbi:MAG: complex I NDUFA9 subunit family protein [Pseudomonadota bacterium]
MNSETSNRSDAQERVTVFGGSGFLGRSLVPLLIEQSYKVRVAARDVERGRARFPKPVQDAIEFVSADLNDEASVQAAVKGSTGVVNLVGILFETGAQKFDSIQARGPEHIARASKEQGIENLVHVSAIGADAQSSAAYARTKAAGEAAVMDLVPSSVIVRPSIVFGPDDQFFNRFADMSKFLPIVPVVGPNTRFQPVFVGDVAEAVVIALAGRAKRSTVYELGGPDIDSFAGLMRTMLRVLGRRRAVLALPMPIAKIQAAVFELLPNPPLTRDQIKLLAKDNIVSQAASSEERTLGGLGITPKTIGEILPTYLN